MPHEQCRLNLKRDALGQATGPRLDIVTAQKPTLKNDKRGVVVAVGARSQAQFVKQQSRAFRFAAKRPKDIKADDIARTLPDAVERGFAEQTRQR